MKKTEQTIPPKQLILRDHLALDRTILANERTFLAYIRTTLALVVVGATLVQITDDRQLVSLGILAIMAGIATLLIGSKRTLTMSRKLSGRKRS
jgi:putative membrane protein